MPPAQGVLRMPCAAIYDNPHTHCREWWIDGKLHVFVTRELLETACIPAGATGWLKREQARAWSSGAIDGDVGAIAPEQRPEPLKPHVVTDHMVEEARERIGLVFRHGGHKPPSA